MFKACLSSSLAIREPLLGAGCLSRTIPSGGGTGKAYRVDSPNTVCPFLLKSNTSLPKLAQPRRGREHAPGELERSL